MSYSATPRHASTVVLVRPGESGGFEILFTRRPRQMRFMGGFYVFPGGSVHEEDYSPSVLERCRGLSLDEARTILGDGLDAQFSLGHWVAGIRELFEEVGVLLCVTESGDCVGLSESTIKQRMEQKRVALATDRVDFGALLEAENLYCDLSQLAYFYHRITPDIYPIRFDTRFYLAPLPAGQVPLDRSEEVAESLWLTPGEALGRGAHSDFPLIPPTSYVLENLAEFSWEELQARYGLGRLV
jgi:8-oxo-dGTP pyrophosphatase MutT (NUDIX family)